MLGGMSGKKSTSQWNEYRRLPTQYEYDEDDDDDSCGFICFALGVIFLFVGVAILATVIVYSQSPEDHSSVLSLTSTREIKPVSDILMSTIEKPYTIETIDDCVNKTSEVPSPLSMLILVQSKPDNLDQRKAIRETWMAEAHKNLAGDKILVIFTIPGLTLTPKQQLALKQESMVHKDMVVLTGSSDNPESELLLFEMIWSRQKYNYKYLMKTRDNMFVRVDALNKEVLHQLLEKKSNVYLGYFEGNDEPHNTNKLAEPDWFLCDRYIRYAHSGGYILSSVLVDRLLSQAKFLHPYNNEDIAMGTWLSPFKDIEFVHNIYFDTNIGKPRGCNNMLIVLQTKEDFSAVQRKVLASGSVCETEFFNTRPYSYDFNKLPSKCCTEL